MTVLFSPLLAAFYRINHTREEEDWSSPQRALHIRTMQAFKLQREVKGLASKIFRKES